MPFSFKAQIPTLVESWKTDKDLKSATLSFCVIDAQSGEIVSELNSHQFVIPASTQKVITTGAILGTLGPNYKYSTKLFYTGSLNKETGILSGDLIIYGSGDPTLQSEYFTKDTNQITDKWAQILKEKGIKEIKGKIIGDASYFERIIPGNWIWADINNYFGAAPCGLSYNDNKFKILYNSKENGTKAIVSKTIPAYCNTTICINSNVISKGTEDEAFVYGDPYSYTKEVSGKIPPNKTNFEVEATLPDPALLCAEKLFTSLSKIGIKCNQHLIESNYKRSDSVISKQLLYTHYSPSLDKIIYHTNLKSNNLYCETLLRTLGKGSMSSGINAVESYWQKKGLDVSELFMVDGSGLSRANTVTTSFQSNLLTTVFNDSALYKIFNSSLPVAGKSGSMSNIGKGKLIENNMRAKTGYINRARGYCGYVKSKSGKDLAFSVLFNNYNCSAKEAKNKIEKFLIAVGEL
ncbi:MAG: D-alanyl-D-alanine carboxypeptidase/D-alanyl-D-alanine-endopeptidase [Bacteroidota bacterium]|nr:D-alanyl-D-alanine carboxypeptidase/D-alanyl-D-alanine-endopeptidase [Bacteroidota bacterium]MDP3146221.1 D-alanyl-D-alanine carboxypeptidase/D-alanyl-D-alanine-endopeptidase [Bacteroidota bacterium]MDP3556626.1 D-alanyl-D-alanine carboxypeptidase/D-alanyl-D-alanine-endopeptidase [Bacteroidota bacterium]